MWRQGDVLIQRVDDLPEFCVRKADLILAEGEASGHMHRVADLDSAELFMGQGGDLFLKVTAEAATIVHDEHGPITLQRGTYRVWKQREYTPDGTMNVED
jgi:hypothetical protein